MIKAFVFLSMIFAHIVDDYYLQGWLASAKQKKYWEENYPEMYKRDYIVALIMHSMSWAFMIMLPIAIFFQFQIPLKFIIIWIVNATIHGFVDNLKANLFKINLIQDQSIHMMQIIITFFLLMN